MIPESPRARYQHRGERELLDGLVEGFSTTEDILERGEFIDEEVIGEIELLESVDDVRLPEAPKEESVHLSKKIGDDNTSMSD